MSDFFQNGVITTLHNLVDRSVEDMEVELHQFAQRNPMTLILPSLYSELEGPALAKIVEKLKGATYINQIVIGLDRANEKQFEHARCFFDDLPQDKRILWNDGPRLKSLHNELVEYGLAPSEPGKGRNVWYCMGFVLAANNARAVALHDCDILTYERDIPARLFYPVTNPAFGYEFCKGYYSRIHNQRLSGRTTRLFVTPLLRSFTKMIGHTDFLMFMDSFRYPLAGEFSMRTDMLSSMRMPSDWGLEVGILSEVFRNTSPRRVCQVDISDNYDHKHQEVGADKTAGLSRMSYEIAKSIIRRLATEGIPMGREFFRSLKATYYREALDMLSRYAADARINNLHIDRHSEEKTIELFSQNIMQAGETYLEQSKDIPLIPNWNRISSAVPNFPERLKAAVEADNSNFLCD